jgi:succinyl-CoA synthetase beta subunit
MNLHEYQSKHIFAEYGIPIPHGRVASNSTEAKQIAEELGGHVVIKSQVLVGGRGKAGGIRLAKNPQEAEEIATQILGMEIKGLPVRKVLVDEAANIETEIYLGITNDRADRKPAIMASSAGGVDIEEVAKKTPEKIVRVGIDPLLGLRDYQARDLAAGIDLPRAHWRTFGQIASGLWRAYLESDATLAEINPLVITSRERLLAVDGKMVLDDNSLFRHPDLAEMRDLDVEPKAETEARKYSLSFIKLDGQIGCMVNGAGLAMATMDIIKLHGGKPANFLDIGGGASSEKVAAALRIILSDPTALEEVKTDIPMVARLVGTNAEEGRQILSAANMITAETLVDAAKKAIAAANGGD